MITGGGGGAVCSSYIWALENDGSSICSLELGTLLSYQDKIVTSEDVILRKLHSPPPPPPPPTHPLCVFVSPALCVFVSHAAPRFDIMVRIDDGLCCDGSVFFA